MEAALALARQGIGRVSPNPAVGAVLVCNGEIVGRGTHTWQGVKHAEVLALEEAGPRARGATLYTTLEPCCHRGRTGPCADALITAGVKRVVAAMQDPNPAVSGQGFERLRSAGIEVVDAPEYAGEAVKLNEAFAHAMRTGRPLVTLKAALTLDGKTAARPGDTGWITSEGARAHAQMLRHASDAIVTGSGTVLADNPLLTDRTGLERSRPLLRVVLDSSLNIPIESRIVQSAAGDVLIATSRTADSRKRAELERRGVRVASFGGLAGLLRFLGEEKYRAVLIEAGARLNGALLDSGLVDKIFFYYAAKILPGRESLPLATGETRAREDAIRLEGLTLHDIGPGEFAVEAYVAR